MILLAQLGGKKYTRPENLCTVATGGELTPHPSRCYSLEVLRSSPQGFPPPRHYAILYGVAFWYASVVYFHQRRIT